MDTPNAIVEQQQVRDADEYALPLSRQQRMRLLRSVVPLVDKYGGAGLSEDDLQWEFNFDAQMRLEAMSSAIVQMEALWFQVVPGIVATLNRIKPNCSFSVRRNLRWRICRADKETNILCEELVLAFGHYRSIQYLNWTLFIYLVNMPADFDSTQLPVYSTSQLDYDSDQEDQEQPVNDDSDSSTNEENYLYYY